MQKVSTKPSHKIPNVLIRYNSSKETRPNTAETSYLRKYFPKYYHHLNLEITSHNPLLTKIKQIKKLKRFTGSFDHEKLPQAIWPSILKNHRKDIEEAPKIILSQSDNKQAELFLERLTQWNLKFLPNLITLTEPIRRRRRFPGMDDSDDSFFVKKSFVKYVRNMRKLKTLEISSKQATKEGLKWLDRMRKILKRLQSLKITLKYYNKEMKILEIFNSQAVISHITSLTFPRNLKEFNKDLALIPKICKNLRSLSIGFQCTIDKNPDFLTFLTRIQKLSELVRLDFSLPKDMKYYWSSFKPQASLKCLRLIFDSSDLIKGGFFDADGKAKVKSIVAHWEKMMQMEEIEFNVYCSEAKDIMPARNSMTMILKKARQLRSLKYVTGHMNKSQLPDEPFFVEENAHIHQSLQRFECSMDKQSYMTFDLSKMRAFKNLKEVKLEGNGKAFENIDELVDLLEREGEYTTLELSVGSVNSIEWFEEIMQKISEGKGNGRNLKIVLEIDYLIDDLEMDALEFFEGICHVMKSVGVIPGLLVRLKFRHWGDESSVGSEELKEVMRDYGEIRNLVVIFLLDYLRMEYRRVDGEKEQLIIKEKW